MTIGFAVITNLVPTIAVILTIKSIVLSKMVTWVKLESHRRRLFLTLLDCSFNLLFDPRGFCKYTSPLTDVVISKIKRMKYPCCILG
jgi:hypothetical protein